MRARSVPEVGRIRQIDSVTRSWFTVSRMNDARRAALNPAVASMARSGIREIMDAAWGRPGVIRLEVGEPDFPTPAHVVEAAHVAALEGHTGYQPSAGIPQLREALAVKVRERNGYTVTPHQTIVTQGGVEALSTRRS